MSSTVQKLFITALALTYLNEIVKEARIKSILSYSMFWVSAGFLIYSLGTFFVSLFGEFLFDPKLVDDETFNIYWNLNNVLFIIFSVLSSIGLWFSKYDSENLI